MYIFRKFAGQVVVVLLLFGTLIAQGGSVDQPSRESVLAEMKAAQEKGKMPPKEIEQRLAVGGQLWDAAQAKGFDAKTSELIVIDIAERSAIGSLDRNTSAALKVFDTENAKNLIETSLDPGHKGIIFGGLTEAEQLGISPDRQKAMFDTMVQMEPRFNEVKSKEGQDVAQAMVESTGDAIREGLNTEKAKERAENIVQIAEKLRENGYGDQVIVGLDVANRGFRNGLDRDGAEKVAEMISNLNREGKSVTETDAVIPAMVNAIKSGASEEKINEAVNNALTTASTSLEETGSTIATGVASSTTGEASIQGNDTETSLDKGKTAGNMVSDIEKNIGQVGAAAAGNTVIQGTVNNQANTSDSAVFAAKKAEEASTKGESGMVVQAVGDFAGQAKLGGKTDEEATIVAGTGGEATRQSQAAGHGTISSEVAGETAAEIVMSAGSQTQPEASETKEEETKPEQETQPEASETKEEETKPEQETQVEPSVPKADE